MIRIFAISLLLAALSACSSREANGIAESTARKAAYERLAEVALEKQIDVSKLPDPAVENNRGKWIYDFRDEQQDVWVVVIVQPDGFAEVSFTKLSE